MIRMVICLGLAMLATACMHLRGVVEEAPGRPSKTAVVSVGRPGGVASFTRHSVDSHGQFDFWLNPLDESDVYVYDSRGDPNITLRRINRTEFGESMRVFVPPGARDTDMGIP